MQHLLVLSEEEFNGMKAKEARLAKAEENVAAAVVASQHLASMLVPEGKCIHDKRSQSDRAPMYCDDCPLSAKTFHTRTVDPTHPLLKDAKSFAFSMVEQFMCTKTKEYSK
jgi:hypothetical protein